MSYIDTILALSLGWAGFKGFRKGFIIEISSIIALVLGVWGAVHLSSITAEWITGRVDDKYIPLISFSLTFIAIVAGVFAIGKLLEKIINVIQLKFVNKLAGAGFGILKALLILGVLFLIVDAYDKKFNLISQQTKDESVLYYPLAQFSQTVIPALQDSSLFGKINVPQVDVDSLLLHKAIESQTKAE